VKAIEENCEFPLLLRCILWGKEVLPTRRLTLLWRERVKNWGLQNDRGEKLALEGGDLGRGGGETGPLKSPRRRGRWRP